MISFSYEIIEFTKTKAPFIKFTLSDPLGKINIHEKALVDTGYDGDLLLAFDKYKELELVSFEQPSSGSTIGETIAGEEITLIISKANLEIEEIDLKIMVDVDTFKECQDIIIGRRFLENFVTTLHGELKEISIKNISTK